MRLGETDVTRIGLGTNRLTNTPEHHAFLKRAVAAGVNLIDTAHAYSGGGSEEAIGAALSPIPDTCVVATKGGWGSGRPEALRAEIEESLRRLQTDSIALYYLHQVDPETPLEKSLGAIKEYRDSGKIRHVGSLQRQRRGDRAGPSAGADRRGAKPLQPRPSASTTTWSITAPARGSCSFPIFR